MAAARANGEWLILDNRQLTLVRDTDMTRAISKFLLDEGGVHRFVPASTSDLSITSAATSHIAESENTVSEYFSLRRFRARPIKLPLSAFLRVRPQTASKAAHFYKLRERALTEG